MALTPDAIKALFEANERRANKALGQNFFIRPDLLESWVVRADLGPEPVLEIGPGLGALTEHLLGRGLTVTAVEKDAFLAERLPELLPDERLTVICGDILRQNLPALFQGPFSAAGNLPYYITTPIIEMLLKHAPETMLLMVQREAADRFFARSKDRVYGPVAIATALWYDTVLLAEPDPSCYWPQPEVSSAVVLLKKKTGAASLPDPAPFLRFLGSVLAHRRKTIVNELGKTDAVFSALASCSIDPGTRAETLPPETLLALFRSLNGK